MKRKLYVLGSTKLDEDQREAIQDFGQAIFLTDRQLVTAEGVAGVAATVAEAYTAMGGTVEYITKGEVPDSKDVVILANEDYANRVKNKVGDWAAHGWLFVVGDEALNQFHMDLLKNLSDKDITLQRYGGGARKVSGRRRARS